MILRVEGEGDAEPDVVSPRDHADQERRVPASGIDEEFDADRFGQWLEVLMLAGAAVAVEKLVGLDINLVIAGFARHAAVFDSAAVASYRMLDGEEVGGRAFDHGPAVEVGGYTLEGQRASAWEALVELLESLASERPDPSALTP